MGVMTQSYQRILIFDSFVEWIQGNGGRHARSRPESRWHRAQDTLPGLRRDEHRDDHPLDLQLHDVLQEVRGSPEAQRKALTSLLVRSPLVGPLLGGVEGGRRRGCVGPEVPRVGSWGGIGGGRAAPPPLGPSSFPQ